MASHVSTATAALGHRPRSGSWGPTRLRERHMSSPAGSVDRVRHLPSYQRLRNRRDFDLVFRHPSVRLTRGPLRLLARPNALGVARLGIVVAKRMIKHAVGRNRAKRVIRESFRLSTDLPGMDIVVRVVQPEPVCGRDADWLFSALARRARSTMRSEM